MAGIDVETKLKKMKRIIKEEDAILQKLQSQAFHQTKFYFVFQGMMIWSICTGAPGLHFSDRWILFVVTLLAAAYNVIAFCFIGAQYVRELAVRDLIWSQICELELKRMQQNENLPLPMAPPLFNASATHIRSSVAASSESGPLNELQNLPSLRPPPPYPPVAQQYPPAARQGAQDKSTMWPVVQATALERVGAGNNGQCKYRIDAYQNLKRYVVFGVCVAVFLGFTGVTLYQSWHIIGRKNHVQDLDEGKCIRFCIDM